MEKPEMEIPVVQNNNNKTPKERFLSSFKGPRKRQDKTFQLLGWKRLKKTEKESFQTYRKMGTQYCC